MAIELKTFDSRMQGSREGAEVRHLDPARAPYYLTIGDEAEIFSAAYKARLPILLKGPTGCGKTRFVEHMAHQLAMLPDGPNELITVACHEDLTGSDLVGRYLISAICYLDEIVEARKDTTVLIHPLSDHRRILPIEKRGETIEAHVGFLLVISYNPGYQSIQKNLKHSTRQRFVTIEFNYPPADKEVEIIAHESGVDRDMAWQLATLGEKVRHLKASGLEEGVSTRLLIYAGELIGQGIAPRRAATVAVTWSLTDELDSKRAIDEVVKAIMPE
jgi:nitric oxide reductase NorQ protein